MEPATAGCDASASQYALKRGRPAQQQHATGAQRLHSALFNVRANGLAPYSKPGHAVATVASCCSHATSRCGTQWVLTKQLR
jgi:hypothetical protein